MKKYEIYQIDPEMTREYGFRSYSDILNYSANRLPKQIYNKMYSGEIEDSNSNDLSICEKLFHTFNCDIPNDFKGHSLSVGDVVVVNHIPYYCDSFGFVKVTVWY